MINKTWSASAPSNIALIKYMGKASGNKPLNPSLSYTTPDFFSTVSVSVRADGDQDQWLADSPHAPPLSAAEQKRFLRHVQTVKAPYQCDTPLIIRGENNFPLGCGLASSASSFAALTRAVSEASSALTGKKPASEATLTGWSRRGSGSSCRSFCAPWCIWDGEQVQAVHLPIMRHMVVVVSAEKKAVSSSEAHHRVLSSENFVGRQARARQRLDAVLSAFNQGDWRHVFSLAWAEFWDMHALFETADPSFGYLTPDSLSVLEIVRQYWRKHNDGPVVTMDAGPNVHLLFRQDQKQHQQRLSIQLSRYQILGG